MIPGISSEELIELKAKAKKASDSTRKLFQKIKSKKPSGLDESFESIHNEVFEKIDCLSCANCCKTISPVFKERDIERISRYLKLSPSLFITKYLHIDSDKDYVLNSSPCAFLGTDNYCSIYDVRPEACSGYPHTNRRKMHTKLDLTMKNTLVCPAAFQIVERIKKEFA